MKNMFSISFRKYRDKEKEKQLVYLDHQNLNSLVRAIITSTAHASSVFLWSYRNTVLNQSACVFALGYFLIIYVNLKLSLGLLKKQSLHHRLFSCCFSPLQEKIDNLSHS